MKALQFEDAGRTFICEPAASPATPDTLWWWVTISGEAQRYAAFRVEPDDTPASLRPRVLAYYAQLLADRARPYAPKASWAGRRQSNTGSAPPAGDASPPDKTSA